MRRQRRSVGCFACGLLVAVLPPQFVRAEASGSQGASQSAAVRGAIEDIERIVRTAPDAPEKLNRIEQQSRNAIGTIARSGIAALPSIETALADPSKDVKVKAMLCTALGQMKDEQADEVLGRILDDPSQDQLVVVFAGRAIAQKRTPTAVAVIKRSVTNTKLPVGVRSHLMTYVGADGLDDVEWLIPIAEGKNLGLPEDAKAEISQDEFTMVLNAQRALRKSKDPRAVDAVIALVDRYPGNGILVEALGKMGDRRAVPVLIKVSANTSLEPLARNDAIRALAELKATEAVEPLIDILQTGPIASTVAAAATALAKIGDKRAVPPLEKLVANLKSDPRFERYWEQAEKGSGFIPRIMKAVEDLK